MAVVANSTSFIFRCMLQTVMVVPFIIKDRQ